MHRRDEISTGWTACFQRSDQSIEGTGSRATGVASALATADQTASATTAGA
jgi:hypothetical protein